MKAALPGRTTANRRDRTPGPMGPGHPRRWRRRLTSTSSPLGSPRTHPPPGNTTRLGVPTGSAAGDFVPKHPHPDNASSTRRTLGRSRRPATEPGLGTTARSVAAHFVRSSHAHAAPSARMSFQNQACTRRAVSQPGSDVGPLSTLVDPTVESGRTARIDSAQGSATCCGPRSCTELAPSSCIVRATCWVRISVARSTPRSPPAISPYR